MKVLTSHLDLGATSMGFLGDMALPGTGPGWNGDCAPPPPSWCCPGSGGFGPRTPWLAPMAVDSLVR